MSKEVMEMTPKPGEDLKEWLGLALTRFALGGVTIGQVVEAWMNSPPRPLGRSAPAPLEITLAAESRYYHALVWVLGAGGDFATRKEDDGPYWWRTELAKRAGLKWDGDRYVSAAALGRSEALPAPCPHPYVKDKYGASVCVQCGEDVDLPPTLGAVALPAPRPMKLEAEIDAAGLKVWRIEPGGKVLLINQEGSAVIYRMALKAIAHRINHFEAVAPPETRLTCTASHEHHWGCWTPKATPPETQAPGRPLYCGKCSKEVGIGWQVPARPWDFGAVQITTPCEHMETTGEIDLRFSRGETPAPGIRCLHGRALDMPCWQCDRTIKGQAPGRELAP